MRKILQKVSAQQITVGSSKVTHRLDRSFIYGEVSSLRYTAGAETEKQREKYLLDKTTPLQQRHKGCSEACLGRRRPADSNCDFKNQASPFFQQATPCGPCCSINICIYCTVAVLNAHCISTYCFYLEEGSF